jgi:8-oxo-dGTP pyrophosphatase MutT (NUDIX family)
MHPIPDLLVALTQLLPRIAEEGSDREEVPETELIQRLADASGAGSERAETVLGVVRRLLQTLSVLDERRLTVGEWAFVSFPASLLARSVLGGLGTPEFRLLELGYWNASDYSVDKQRALIKGSEEIRAALPAGLVPIRRVWVSWAWIALDGKFLMVRREDPAPHRDGSRGRFVFPGGRVSSEDLPEPEYLTPSRRLDFFDPNHDVDASHIRYAFSQAVGRELREELEIPTPCITSITPAIGAIHYNALEGIKSAFSATEYYIQPFKIALNDAGKTAFLRCLASNADRFAWFTAEELAAGVNAAGATAFVDAIRQNESALDPESYTIPIGDVESIREAIDIPGSLGEPFSVGITGREKQIHLDLDVDEISTLGWFAAVRRGENVGELATGISIASDTGWVLVDDDNAFSKLKNLTAKLEGNGLLLLDFHERAVRLNAAAPYFAPSLLSMEILDERRGKTYRLKLSRRALHSPLGVATEHEATTILPEMFGNAVYALAQGEPGPALDNIETVKRMQRDIRGHLDTIGARLLIRQVDGVPELAVGQR